MRPIYGYLRNEVKVTETPNGIELQFSVWNILLPADLIKDNHNIAAFFQGKIPSSELIGEKAELDNLIHILAYQGCLVPEYKKAEYSLLEVKEFFISFCNDYYGRYYSHPLWAEMRKENIPIEFIRQWISRTYFLSRFAGVTASAASKHAPTNEVKAIFLKSAVEEYSHCQDYYYPPKPLFNYGSDNSNEISPSASFSAFDQQMLHIARHDWLAHLFIAMFQERTANFKNSADNLYTRIEKQLNIPHLFDGWRTHISFDEDNTHQNDLDTLFEQPLKISQQQLEISFSEAALAINILIDGLSDIFTLGEEKINPRVKVKDKIITKDNISGLKFFSQLSDYQIKSDNIIQLVSELTMLIANDEMSKKFLISANDFIYNQINNVIISATISCLENCDNHNDIITIGRLLEEALKENFEHQEIPHVTNKSSRVFWNFIHSKSKCVSEYIFCLLFLTNLLAKGSEVISQSGSKNNNLTKISKNIINNNDKSINSLERINAYINIALDTLGMLEYTYLQRDQHTNNQVFFSLGKR